MIIKSYCFKFTKSQRNSIDYFILFLPLYWEVLYVLLDINPATKEINNTKNYRSITCSEFKWSGHLCIVC
jgi:hypothetical protein